VTLEGVPDCFACNVPNSDQLVFGSGGQISTIWTEANAPDVQISFFIDCIILKLTDFLASVDIVYLGRAIAACGNVLAILAKAHTTYDTFVQKVVKKLDIKNSG